MFYNCIKMHSGTNIKRYILSATAQKFIVNEYTNKIYVLCMFRGSEKNFKKY